MTALSAFMPRIAYVSYHVKDIERAVSFYVETLGMEEQLRLDVGSGEHEAVLAFPENKAVGLLLIWKDGREEPYDHGDAYSRLVIRVSDVDGAVEELKRRGVSIASEPADAEVVRFAMIRDPEGYLIEVLQVRRR